MTRRRQGFTIMELSVTVVILLILSAIAYPRLTGAQNGIREETAKQILLRVAVDQEAFYRTYGHFATASDDLRNLSDAADLVTGEPTAPGAVGVSSRTDPGPDGSGGVTYVGLATRTEDGTCLTLRLAQPDANVAKTSARFTPSAQTLPCSGLVALLQEGRMW